MPTSGYLRLTMNVRTVYLGLGTNLSDRHAWLDQGLAALEEALVTRKSIQAMSMSPRYETEAWGMAEGTPAFLNMVVGVDTDMPLVELLRVLLDIERAHGRVRDAILGWGTARSSVLQVSPSEVHKMSMSNVRLR